MKKEKDLAEGWGFDDDSPEVIICLKPESFLFRSACKPMEKILLKILISVIPNFFQRHRPKKRPDMKCGGRVCVGRMCTLKGG